MSEPKNASVATVRLAGCDYPAVTERNCFVCRSPYRETIEQQLVDGRAGSHIVAALPDDVGLTSRNIHDHYRHGHLPISEPAVRAMVSRRAEERGEGIRPAVDSVVEHLEFARGLVSRVRVRVATGELEPDIRDGLRAAEFVARFEPPHEMDDEVFVQAFLCYHDAASKIMTPSQFQQFGDLLEEDPTLRRLEEEWRRQRDRPSASSAQ